MNAEIITIGTELLLGQIIDTNSAYIGENMARIGVNVYRKISIGDNELRLEKCIRESLKRVDVVIATGGLGPTVDDITKKVAVKIFKRKAILDEKLLEKIKKIFRIRNLHMPDNNISQAMIPKGVLVIDNNTGTAPGLIFTEKNKTLILLPGVPSEMKLMFENGVIPYLKKRTVNNNIIVSKVLKVWGLSESSVDEKIFDIFVKLDNPTIALLASMSEVKIRITARAENEKKAGAMISKVEKEIRNRLDDNIFGVDDQKMEDVAADMLIKKSMSVSVAESCTGGLISYKLTNIPGSSAYFNRGVVVYSNKSKTDILGVPTAVIKKYGAVSKEVSMLMAENIRKTGKTDIGLSTTGIAGPTGATNNKPIGLVYISLASKQGTITQELRLKGEREIIKERASISALDILRKYLLKL